MSPADDLRLADAVEEYRALLKSGRRPNRRAFLEAHADIAGPLAEYLDALEFVQSAAPDLGPLTGPGSEELAAATPLGDFRLLREVGRGGMGIVYEAEQLSLGRRVALKVLPFAAALDPRRLQRFRNEAQAAAQLRHPNIVPVYAVGCERGVHYYAMDFIEGDTLAALIRGRRRLAGRTAHPEEDLETTTAESPEGTDTWRGPSTSDPPAVFLRTAVRWMVQAAEAIEHAHQIGVIHRDVKPANLLVDSAGTLWVTDFGLAQVLNDTRLTRTGDLLGTLRYMSPEQALGDAAAVGPRSDVYSLGATLYELVTLEPVVDGHDRQELLRHIASTDPRPPRRFNPAVPVELETIALKALAKAPEERYCSAGELAEDLRRFLEDRPIRARPPTLVQRARQVARRHAAIATTVVTAAFLLLVVVVIAAVVLAVHQHEAAESAETARRQIAAALAEQQAARTAADEARKNEQIHRRQVEELLERQQVAQALRLLAEDDPHGAMRATVESLRLVQGDPLREEMHRFRFGAALQRCPRLVRVWFHDGAVKHAEFSPDGTRVLTASVDGTVRVWNTSTGQPVTPPLHHASEVVVATFDPEGQRILTASGDGTVRVWNADTGRPLGTPMQHRPGDLHAAFSPDERRVCSVDVGGTARIWDSTTGRLTTALPHPAVRIHRVAFRPDGERVATISADAMLRVWNVATGKLIDSAVHLGSVGMCVAYRPDGRVLVVGTQAGAKLWEEATGKLVAHLDHSTVVNKAVFSADGRMVATVSLDTTARVWDADSGAPISPLLRHGTSVRDAAFSPDGSRVFTAGGDGRVRCWDVKTGESVSPPLQHSATVRCIAVHPNSGFILSAGEDDTARLWDVRERTPPTGTHERLVYHATFSPDGRLVASASWDGTARIWNAETGQPDRANTLRHGGQVRRVVFSPDGRRVATASLDGTARVWDTDTGAAVTPFLKHEDQVHEITFTLDGQRVLTVRRDGAVQLWDAASGERVKERLKSGLQPGNGQVFFDPDPRYAATKFGNSAQVWSRASGEPLGEPLRHRDGIETVRFSPDGSRVVTTSIDSTARVWAVMTGQPITPPLPHASRVLYGEFSPDGRRVLTASYDCTARVWDATSGEPVAAPLRHPDIVWHAAFSPDGRRIVTACGDGKVRVWPLPFEDRPVEDLVRFTEVRTGMEFQGSGRWVPLDLLRFRIGWAEMRSKYPGEFPAIPQEEMQGWDWRIHQRRARLACAHARWDQALSEFSLALERGSDDPELWRERGAVYANVQKWDRAVSDWSRAIERDPDDPRLWADRSQAHAFLRRWPEAVADASRALALAPDEPRYLARRVAANRGQYRWDDTAADLARLTELTPYDAAVWRDLAFARAHQGRGEEAMQSCERAIELAPSDPASWVERGRLHDANGRWGEARKDYARAVELDSTDAWTWCQYAVALAESGDGDAFGQHAARMMERFGDSTDLRPRHYVARAAVLLPRSESDLERITRLVESTLREKPRGAGFLATAALAHYRAGRYREAIASARAAQDGEHVTPFWNGGHAVSWLVLAMAHHRLGKRQEAHDWLSRAARWMDTTPNRKSSNPAASYHWQGYAREEQLLRREAEALIAP